MYSEIPTSQAKVQGNQNLETKRFGEEERPEQKSDTPGLNNRGVFACRFSSIFEVLLNA